MSYLKNNNNKVVVDAILTDYGKKKLAAQGKLDIYKFAVADDEVDYSMWNSNNPDGSDFYNYAIVNLPILQALPGSTMTMKYPLFTQNAAQPGYVESMTVTYDYTITGSKSNQGAIYARNYSFQPSISPSPGDITRIYYIAYISANVPLEGAGFRIDPTINQDIGITADIQKQRDYYASIPGGQYFKVGHGFTFRALVPPRTRGFYVYLHLVPYKVSAKSIVINIYLPPIKDAIGYNANALAAS
jgi:hypothetical protein